MKKEQQTILGIIILLLVVGALFFWYRTTAPASEKVSTTAQKIMPVDRDLLRSDDLNILSKLELNGNLPITVDPAELGRDDPFANY